MARIVSTNVRLPEGLHRALKHRAVAEGRSLGQVIRDAAVAYLSAPGAPDGGETTADDPLFLIGTDAVEADVADGSERHDDYLYRPVDVYDPRSR